jgi:hypothetical protein
MVALWRGARGIVAAAFALEVTANSLEKNDNAIYGSQPIFVQPFSEILRR